MWGNLVGSTSTVTLKTPRELAVAYLLQTHDWKRYQ